MIKFCRPLKPQHWCIQLLRELLSKFDELQPALLALCTPKEVGQKLALCQRKGLNPWAFPGYCKGYDAINLPGMMTSFNVLNELVLCLSILSPCTTIVRMIFSSLSKQVFVLFQFFFKISVCICWFQLIDCALESGDRWEINSGVKNMEWFRNIAKPLTWFSILSRGILEQLY